MTIALAPQHRTARAEPVDGVRLAPEAPADAPAVMRLVDRAFGPGRFAKTSERIREGNQHLPDLSYCVHEGADLIGTVRQWPVLVGDDEGLFLGPIAVDAAHRSRGFGAALIAACVAGAQAAGAPFILLVGDAPVFGPHGFVIAPAGRIVTPAPVAPGRLLVRPLVDGVEDRLLGLVRAPPSPKGRDL